MISQTQRTTVLQTTLFTLSTQQTPNLIIIPKKPNTLPSRLINRLPILTILHQKPHLQKKTQILIQLSKTQIRPIHNLSLQTTIPRNLQNLSHNIQPIPTLTTPQITHPILSKHQPTPYKLFYNIRL